DGGYINTSVLQNRVGCCHCTKVTARAGIRHPGSGRILTLRRQHIGQGIRWIGWVTWIKKRRGPIRNRDACPRRAVWQDVAEAVGDRHYMTASIYSRQRSENIGGSMRDQRGMVIRVQNTVSGNKVEQVGHLLQVRRDIGIVASKMSIVKLH